MKLIQKLVAVPAIVATIAVSGCGSDGYRGKCAQAVSTARSNFKKVCSERLDRTLNDHSLDNVIAQRDGALKAAGCEMDCERWYCGRGAYSDYEAKFVNENTCSGE